LGQDANGFAATGERLGAKVPRPSMTLGRGGRG